MSYSWNVQSQPYSFDCSVALKWLKNAEINFNPQGDLQHLQDINQFMAAKCEYNIWNTISIVILSLAGTIFRSKGHSLLKLAEFIEVMCITSKLFMKDIRLFYKTVYPLDENGQPIFTLDMDAQRKAVFKVFDPFHFTNHKYLLRSISKKRVLIMNKDHRLLLLNVSWLTQSDHVSFFNYLGPKKLHYWCLAPGFAMRQLCMQNTRSILLTSGTLSPIDSFKTQLAM
jgi:hypothetical protein